MQTKQKVDLMKFAEHRKNLEDFKIYFGKIEKCHQRIVPHVLGRELEYLLHKHL